MGGFEPMNSCPAWPPHGSLPSRQVDKRHRRVCEVVDQYRQSSFRTLSFDISVLPDTRTNIHRFTSTPGLGYPQYLRYIFSHWERNPQSLLVKIDKTDVVHVKVHKRWMTLLDYLKLFPISPDPNDFEYHYRIEHQAHWWLHNKMTFRFLDLPGEVRNNVYISAMGSYIEPYPCDRTRGRRVSTVANASLLRANKQIYSEAKHIVYANTPFYVQHPKHLTRLLRNLRFPITELKTLELALSHTAFLTLFGRSLQGGVLSPRNHTFAAEQIQEMRLARLTLIMPDPRELHQHAMTHGCQRAVVDWILDAAWVFVSGQPVVVSGYVKASQKLAFEAKALEDVQKRMHCGFCTETYDRVAWQRVRVAAMAAQGDLTGEAEECEEDDEDGGVRLDGAAGCGLASASRVVDGGDTAGQEQTTVPPVCCCTVNCLDIGLWTSED